VSSLWQGVLRAALARVLVSSPRSTASPRESGCLAQRRWGNAEILVAGRERLFLGWLFDHKARRPDAIDAVAREHYARSFAAPGAARAGFDYYRALLSTHGLQRMRERVARPLTMPVLAVGADGGIRARLAESLDGAAVSLHSVVLAGGHYLPEEAPVEFTQAVLNFWENTAPIASY
jgi:pimeloyl-ACP methyl ester carboxylesterase